MHASALRPFAALHLAGTGFNTHCPRLHGAASCQAPVLALCMYEFSNNLTWPLGGSCCHYPSFSVRHLEFNSVPSGSRASKWQLWSQDLTPGIWCQEYRWFCSVPSTPFLLDLDSILKGEAHVLSFFFSPHGTANRILVPWPGIEPRALRSESPQCSALELQGGPWDVHSCEYCNFFFSEEVKWLSFLVAKNLFSTSPITCREKHF